MMRAQDHPIAMEETSEPVEQSRPVGIASEPPIGEPPGETPPVEAPPPGEPLEAPVPAEDPPQVEPPMTEPPTDAPPMQAAVADLEPDTPPPPSVEEETGAAEFLPELSTPLEGGAGERLSEGSILQASAGPLRITGGGHLKAGVQHYNAETSDQRIVCVRAAAGPAREHLEREAELLVTLRSPMLPTVLDQFEQGDSLFLVTEVAKGPTLSEALSGNQLSISQVVGILAQVTHAAKQLHAAGWVHLGLRPADIVIGKPIKLTDLSFITQVGERPATPFYHAGYSPPELLREDAVDPRADVYAIGALLFHAVNGQPIAETGVELSTWEPPLPIGGVPQILERCLGPRDSRYPTLEPLHRDLLRLVRRLAPPIRYSIAASTSIGLEPSRTTNQDAYVWLTGSVASEEGLREWAVLCVSDGMGGMAAGEVASNAAVRRLAAEAGPAMARFDGMTAEDQVRVVKQWMHAANESAVDAMERLGVRGGATLVCACMVGRRLTISHVGDCRIYLLRAAEIRQLNRDHSLVMALALQGQIKVEAIRNHPDRSTITRSLGDRRPLPDSHVDTLEQVNRQPTLELEPGDILLLCSDGLWEPVVESQMQQSVAENAPDLATAADELVRLALEGGGPDNVAVLLFRLDQGTAAEEKRAC